jgi:hypothetical protein
MPAMSSHMGSGGTKKEVAVLMDETEMLSARSKLSPAQLRRLAQLGRELTPEEMKARVEAAVEQVVDNINAATKARGRFGHGAPYDH